MDMRLSPPTLGGVLDGFSNGEGENLFLSPLQPRNAGGGWGGGVGGVSRARFPPGPHLRQPFQLTTTPSPATRRLFRTTKNWSRSSVLGLGPSRSGAGPQAPGGRAQATVGPGPKPLDAPAQALGGLQPQTQLSVKP